MKPTEPPADNELVIEVEHREGVPIVLLRGAATMDVSAGLRDKLIELARSRPAQIVIDLSDLEFISSVGLGAILAAHLKCRHHQGVIKLVNPKKPILELLNVTKLTKLFGIFPSVEAALSA